MIKQLFAETLIIAAGTLFFFVLAATVGIPGGKRNTPRAIAAEEVEYPPPAAMPGQPFLEPPGPFAGGWGR